MAAGLTVATSLPWFVAQLMPDVFTGALVLVLCLLALSTDACRVVKRVWLALLATFMIAAHQSHVLLALALLLALRVIRPSVALRAIAPLVLAILALVSVNLVAFGRASLSPFGNVFLLARVIYDGPGADVLRRDCPAAGWRLCAFADRLPETWDDFLWRQDGPVAQAGGAKVVSQEADAIILAALRAEPRQELAAFLRNAGRQLAMFATGDGLHPGRRPSRRGSSVTFPGFEARAYAASRQSSGELRVPPWMRRCMLATALAGVAGCLALLPAASRSAASGRRVRRRGLAGRCWW